MRARRDPLSRRAFLRGTTATAVAATAASSSAAAQEGGQTHTVEMTDDLVFDPDSITVAPGDTVVWENVGTVGHSVTAYADEIPDEAEYFASGGFDTEDAARSAYPEGNIPGGESYEYAFEVAGTYGYFCIPHESAGMVGTVEVREGGAGSPAGAGPPSVPDAAKSLAVAAGTALLSVLALVYFFLKYGGDYEGDTERTR